MDSTHLLDGDKSTDNEEPSREKKKFPRSVFFIIGNEFCERFSYYGIRACLSIYLITQLDMKQSTATTLFHTFLMVCYFMPLFGSMLADGYLGKFWTIFFLSLIYASGSIVLSLTSVPPLEFPMLPMSLVGLFLIALGTGGIKPCVSAFGGDQFQYDQVKQRERFFFIFYFTINFGSLLSTFLTPNLKVFVPCFGNDTCYSLAFGVPAILMIISVLIFVAGKNMYNILPPTNNIIKDVSKCIGHAIKRRWKSNTKTRNHWLDYADDEFDAKFISDVRAALRVMYLFLPLPLFWALFDQQGSLWTFQAWELDGRLTNSYEILPEQMQVINPLLILILIPLFEMVIYPLLAKCNVSIKPLRRMFVGGMLAALAFVVAGVLQLTIESEYPVCPPAGYADISFINNGPCFLDVKTVNGAPFPLNITLDNQTFYSEIKNVTPVFNIEVTPGLEGQCPGLLSYNFTINATDERALTVAFVVQPFLNNTLIMFQEAKLLEKPTHGNSALRLVYNLRFPGYQIMLKKEDNTTNCTFNIDEKTGAGITNDGIDGTFKNDYCYTTPGSYYLYLPNGTNGNMINTYKKFNPLGGGQYDVNIYSSGWTESEISVNDYAEVPATNLSMLLQVSQYVIMTCAEIMFSISGLEFSYSQAPASMKAVLQAAWLLTVAFGNLIVIFISEAKLFNKYSYHYFLYAGLMAVVMFLFAFMCKGYAYVSIDREGNVIYPGGQEVRRNSTSSNDSGSTVEVNDESENNEVSLY